jgi:hypothetical protein
MAANSAEIGIRGVHSGTDIAYHDITGGDVRNMRFLIEKFSARRARGLTVHARPTTIAEHGEHPSSPNTDSNDGNLFCNYS